MPLKTLLQKLPKVSLHDHLDGGLRPQTIIDLAAEIDFKLPTNNAEELAQWFVETANSGSLEKYLTTFDITTAVMQTERGLARVAKEAVDTFVADGVLYGELRWAPGQHTKAGLTIAQAVEAVQDGIDAGVAAAAAAGVDVGVRQIVTAMRHEAGWLEIAELAVKYKDRGVAGFDIAGAEAGFSPSLQPETWLYLREQFLPFTIHAAEGDGVESLADALAFGAPNRIGHGVRIVEDITFAEDGSAELGSVANWVLNNQIPLELCPSSNLQTGAATSISEHPISVLRDLDFAVTINPDNRLVSGTSMTKEMQLLVEDAGWELADLRQATLTAAWNAFIDHNQRVLLAGRINSDWDRLEEEYFAS